MTNTKLGQQIEKKNIEDEYQHKNTDFFCKKREEKKINSEVTKSSLEANGSPSWNDRPFCERRQFEHAGLREQLEIIITERRRLINSDMTDSDQGNKNSEDSFLNELVALLDDDIEEKEK